MSNSGLERIFHSFPSLETERLRLRAITDSDIPALFSIFSDPEVTEFYDLFAMDDQDQAAGLLERWRDYFDRRKAIRWGITQTGEDRVIGTIGLRVESDWKAALGYDLAPQFWRKGIMTEALGAVIAFAFEEAELERLEALVIPGNIASTALLNKLGFEKEGLLRKYAYFKEDHQDLECYSLLRGDQES